MDCSHNFMNESIKTPHFMDSQKGLPPQPQDQTLVPGQMQKHALSTRPVYLASAVLCAEFAKLSDCTLRGTILQAPHPTKTVVGCSAPAVRAATSLKGCPPAGQCLH